MSRRPVTPLRVDELRRSASVGIVRAPLLEADVDRRKRIDRYIDYFGNGGSARRIGVTRGPRGESLLDPDGAR